MYVISIISFVVIDALWLLVISKNLYKKELGNLMTDNPNLIAAIIFYVIYTAVLIYFVINPSIIEKDLTNLLIKASLFGLITYFTYDITNFIILKNYPLKIVIIDIIWGIFIVNAVSFITYNIYNFIK